MQQSGVRLWLAMHRAPEQHPSDIPMVVALQVVRGARCCVDVAAPTRFPHVDRNGAYVQMGVLGCASFTSVRIAVPIQLRIRV